MIYPLQITEAVVDELRSRKAACRHRFEQYTAVERIGANIVPHLEHVAPAVPSMAACHAACWRSLRSMPR
jgi:hypothetical protein